MDIIAYGGAAVGMLVTLAEYAKGNVGLAGAIAIILLASEFFIPLRLLGSFFHIAMNGMAASDKIFALLDEPTSNLDALNEGIILKSLGEARGNRTIVLVSHRTSTMNLADMVVEMGDGSVS